MTFEKKEDELRYVLGWLILEHYNMCNGDTHLKRELTSFKQVALDSIGKIDEVETETIMLMKEIGL